MLNHVIQRPYFFGVGLALAIIIARIAPIANIYISIHQNGDTYIGIFIYQFVVIVSSILALIITILQYLSVKLNLKPEDEVDRRLNVTSLVFGIIVVVWFIAMAAWIFIEGAHDFAILTGMYIILAYQLMQTVLTYRTKPGSHMAKGRLALSIITIICAFINLLLSFTLVNTHPGRQPSKLEEVITIIYAVSYFLNSILLLVYYLTFIQEMKDSRIHLGFEVVHLPTSEVPKRSTTTSQ